MRVFNRSCLANILANQCQLDSLLEYFLFVVNASSIINDQGFQRLVLQKVLGNNCYKIERQRYII